MIFWIETIAVWYRKGGIRTLTFKNNKVNVVTGGSHAGKTAILQIFDYCFFASKSKLPENTINENVAWYGIQFRINDKHFTIARGALRGSDVSDEYYFSPSGEMPKSPQASHDADTIRDILEPEFGVDRSVTIPFGGKSLRAGSRIGIRYFFLFNTISENIITHSSVFFDKQDDSRYAEALVRVFDLATGIEQIADLIAREEHSKLERELKILQKRLVKIDSVRDEFLEEQSQLIRKAKELGIVAPDAEDDMAKEALRLAVQHPELVEQTTEVSERQSEIRSTIALYNRIIRNLNILTKEYDDYRKHLATVEDSLKPVSFLRQHMSSIVQTSYFDEILISLESDLSNIKRDLRKKVPISLNIGDLIADYQGKVSVLRDELASLPVKAETFVADRDRYLFLGELKAKLEFFDRHESNGAEVGVEKKIEEVEKQLGMLHVTDPVDRREMFLKLLEEIISEYMSVAGSAMDTYEGYLPVFDYKSKTLLLRKPRTSHKENVGSSSNHMFLHLFLFLGLHEVLQIQGSPFVPPLLIIDQPSRPYWGDGVQTKKKLDSTDEQKIRKAFEVLNYFVQRRLENGGQCQIIVFEHVPPSTWDGLEHVHLVEKFTEGNALIRSADLSKGDNQSN